MNINISIHLQEERWTRCKNILMNLLGSILLAFGVYAFIAPFGLIVGGATGISLILHRLFGIPISIISLCINVGVLPLALIFKEKKLFFGSILSSLAYPVAMGVFERFPKLQTIADNTMLAAICGGIVCGCAIGLVMKSGGSTGGVDIPILLLHKKIKMPVGKMVNICDTCIMLGQVPIFGLNAIIYGLIYTYIMTHSLSTMLTMGEDCIRVTIISEKYEELRRVMIENDFGMTVVFAQSGYTYTDILKLESIMRESHLRKAKKLIDQVDPEAFVTIEKVRSVHGRGYTMERIYIEQDW